MEMWEFNNSVRNPGGWSLYVHTVPTVYWGSSYTEQGPQETQRHG